MAEISNVNVIRHHETDVRGPDGANRFITVVGSIDCVPAHRHGAEQFTCLIGPCLEPHQYLGATCLASLAGLDLLRDELAECSLNSHNAEFDVDSGRVELSVELLTGGVRCATIVFSVTILIAG
jgi:hypothetical protein